MTQAKKLSWLLLSALALLCATCAPQAPPPDEAEAPPAPPAPAERVELLAAPKALGGRADVLGRRIEAAVESVRRRDLLTTHAFWTVFHGILGLGPEVTLLDPRLGARAPALDYICAGGELRGLQFIPTPHGLDVRTGPTFVGQGHQDQFVAELAQWGISPERTFVVGGKKYTYMDFVRHTQARASVNAKQELSWAVLVIGQYVGTDVTWTNEHGETLRFEDLLRYELAEPMDKAACGGTHRLFDLSWVHHLHLQRGGKTAGVWKDVADNTARYTRRARELRNPDGSLSTEYLRGRGNARDLPLRINTTGHVLEWLALALPDSRLREPWVEEAASALAQMILEAQDRPVEGGSLYHAVHGLLIYHSRVFNGGKPSRPGLTFPLPPG